MMKAKGSQQNRVMRILAIPIRALAKARDLYVKSMNSYADRVYCGSGAAPGYSSGYSVPRSFSTSSMRSSQDEDFKELVRAASTKSLGNRVDLTSALSRAGPGAATSRGGGRGVPRSASVGMAKIEEDKACEDFVDLAQTANNNANKGYLRLSSGKDKGMLRMFPRSKSYAVPSATNRIPSAF